MVSSCERPFSLGIQLVTGAEALRYRCHGVRKKPLFLHFELGIVAPSQLI